MKRLLPKPWEFLLASLGSLAVCSGCRQASNEYAEPPPPAVVVAHPVQQELTLFTEETGQLEAAEQAEVRARVRGFVEEILFEPGYPVKVGDELYRIERGEYETARDAAAAALAAAEAAILVAEAGVKMAEAELERTERDFAREAELIKENATSQREYESALAARSSALATRQSALAAVEAAKSEVGREEANVRQAELDLQYTIVKAPISGRITKTNVNMGNLVENGTALATIVDDSEIYANFNISDREALRYLERAKAEADKRTEGETERDWTSIAVYLRRENDSEFAFRGHLDYVDQMGIDAPTGTLAVRAVFDNSQQALLPGLFVYLRIPIQSLPEAILIPEAAVRRDPTGVHVLSVGSDHVVQRRDVKLGPKQDQMVVVESGLSTDDLVVIQGQQRARPGAKVNPQRAASDDAPEEARSTANAANAENISLSSAGESTNPADRLDSRNGNR